MQEKLDILQQLKRQEEEEQKCRKKFAEEEVALDKDERRVLRGHRAKQRKPEDEEEARKQVLPRAHAFWCKKGVGAGAETVVVHWGVARWRVSECVRWHGGGGEGWIGRGGDTSPAPAPTPGRPAYAQPLSP